MAEANNDPHVIDDEDLEDGEIETDEENDVIIEEPKPAPKPVIVSSGSNDAAKEPSVKKTKVIDEEKPSKAERKIEKNATVSSKNSTGNDAAADDWMGDVEYALAMALKKDGIAPKSVKITSKPTKETKDEPKEAKEQKESKETGKNEASAASSGKSSSKRRKHKSDKEEKRKKVKLNDDDNTERPYSNESEDFDEYEMMNVRGGSPPHGGQTDSQKRNMYDSDASYSSFDSYDSGDHRRRQRPKRRPADRNSRRSHRTGNSKRDKRRRDDSDDESIGPSSNNRYNDNMYGNNSGNNNCNRNSNNNNQPRKAELCKFYLMECCAKGEKCLYMHGDFPCKYYYLGMNKNHIRETCKFSHGKPLTDQMRALLLKHLETAPKEILGDFPRLARDNAINMLNAQHQKLMVKFGMEPDPNINPSSTSSTSKLPSLLDLNLPKYPPPSNDMNNKNMKDKPRKSRWCEPKSNESDSNSLSRNNQSSATATAHPPNEHDIKLSTLTGTLTAEQVDKLAKMGIETISQVTQLTVLQVIELGLSIALISELQLKAVQLQQSKQQQQQEQRSSQNPENESEARDKDMRLQFNSSNKADDPPIDKHAANELTNRDVDMRILAMPRKASNKNHSDDHSKNSHSSKHSTDRSNEQKKIDYSQYLKDANIDLGQSDLEDRSAENASRGKKRNDDSDEDEANPLVIEEEDEQLHIDDHASDNEDGSDKRNKHSNDIDMCENDKLKSPGSTPSPDSNSSTANAGDDLLPAFYAPSSIFPTSVTKKIDLSSSVSKYLKKETLGNESSKKTDSFVTKTDNDSALSDTNNDGDSTGSRSPPSRNPPNSFEFFSRQIPETNHPAPQALDEKTSPTADYDSTNEANVRNSVSPTVQAKQIRKSIYEMSSDDEDNNDGDNIRSPSDGDNDDSQDSRKQSTYSLSKDKDMRISAFLMEKDFSNGDIDLRLPFKPVMANYIPATEIDASITSHAPIAYSVKEVDIPKPDYSELRKSIPSHENTLDPRLRRILRLKDDYSDSDSTFLINSKTSTPFSPPHEADALQSTPNPFSMQPKNDTVPDPRRARADPRRQNANMQTTTNTNPTNPNSMSVLTKPAQKQRSLHLDIQNILQKSNWYKDCSSKQKIMVNQQLAIVSTELKKFHADPSENKVFDLKFILQNPLLQEVLTNLGIFISDDGEFIEFDQASNQKDQQNQQRSVGGGGNPAGLVDLMSIPMGNNIDIDFLRNQQQQQQQQQQAAAMQQAMMAGPRFLNAPGSSAQMLGFGSVNDVIRPGLLGIAPNLTISDAFLMQNAAAAQNASFYNRSTGNANSGADLRRGGNNRQNNMRRNQFDRNNSRRDKK